MNDPRLSDQARDDYIASLFKKKDPNSVLGVVILLVVFLCLIVVVLCGCANECWAEEWVATAYCPCEKCCGKSDGITASGKKAVEGRTVAVNWLKFGQKVALNGKTYIVEDRGAKSIFGSKDRPLKRIDIYFDNHNDALRFGRQKVNVEVM